MEGKVGEHDRSIRAFMSMVKQLADADDLPRKSLGYKGGDEI